MTLRLPLLSLLALFAAAAPAHAVPRFEKVDSAQITKAPLGTDYALGNPKAPVVLVEYASLTCPHCAHFHRDVLPALTKNYIDTGKLVYVLRPYPLNEPALKASMLLDCIGEQQGAPRYYTFARVLFEAQSKWAFDTNWLSSLQTFAKVGGVSGEMFEQCTTDSGLEIKLLNMKRNATKDLQIDKTPYVFINGHRYDDALNLEKITAYIDSQLPKKKGEGAKSGSHEGAKKGGVKNNGEK